MSRMSQLWGLKLAYESCILVWTNVARVGCPMLHNEALFASQKTCMVLHGSMSQDKWPGKATNLSRFKALCAQPRQWVCLRHDKESNTNENKLKLVQFMEHKVMAIGSRACKWMVEVI